MNTISPFDSSIIFLTMPLLSSRIVDTYYVFPPRYSQPASTCVLTTLRNLSPDTDSSHEAIISGATPNTYAGTLLYLQNLETVAPIEEIAKVGSP